MTMGTIARSISERRRAQVGARHSPDRRAGPYTGVATIAMLAVASILAAPSPVDGCLHGKLLGTADLVAYEGQTVTELEAAFQRAVDQYLSDREASRQWPRGDSQ